MHNGCLFHGSGMNWQYFTQGEVFKLTLGGCKVESQGQSLIVMIIKKYLKMVGREIIVSTSKAYTQASYH